MNTETQATLPVHGAVVDIPLSKLKASPRNARRTPHTEAAIAALAASIAVKGVLQPPTIEPETDGAGEPTGFYLVTIGEGRRLALLLLAKRKTIKKAHPVRCIVDLSNDAHEISLDENVTRSGMHPADEFEAFQRMADERGFGPEEIAARFGVTPTVVRQRLKLAVVSPALIQAYRDEAMTLDHLMAFAVSDDHARQEQVWEGLGWNKSPSLIRRSLMETKVPASDRRAVFVGAEAYAAAGGQIVRDLFSDDAGGWFADPALLDRLAGEKLAAMAGELREREGWKWGTPLDQASAHGLRRIYPRPVERSADEQAAMAALSEAYDALVEEWQHVDEVPPEIEARFAAMNAELEVFGDGHAYEPADIARGGVFLLLEHDGTIRFERGFIRPEDEPEPEPRADGNDGGDGVSESTGVVESSASPKSVSNDGDDEETEADTLSPLSDKLVADLTAHRTAGLRDALADRPNLALLALIHALALSTFYRGYDLGTCLELEVKSTRLGQYAPGIDEGVAMRSIETRHANWAGRLPQSSRDVWETLVSMADDERMALMAHCVSLSINGVRAFDGRRGALAHADTLAQAVGLDMRAYWTPTVASYFGRVSKARIQEAVREGYSLEAAHRIEGLKKGPMADLAEEALAGKGWLPPLLRTAASEDGSEVAEAQVEPDDPPASIAAE